MMIDAAQCGVIVLAAGRSLRYGPGNKLLHPVRGRPMAQHVALKLSSIGFAERIAVCGLDPRVAELFSDAGFRVVTNDEPEAGQSASLRIAIDAIGQHKAILICLADMPFVSTRQIHRLMAEFSPERKLLASAATEYRGPPALFADAILREANLTGDQGGRPFLAGAHFINASDHELCDFDSVEDFERWETEEG